MALVTTDFNINITPGEMPPTVQVSEYDIGRSYNVTLIDENGSAFTIPTGTTATVEGTLNGVVGFTISATISNNKITFALTESMTAYAGEAWCKIKLTLNDEPIQTCAFVLAVDRAGVEADTVIGADGFEQQLQNAVEDWLEEHPIQVDVDSTLTHAGEAADAKATGDGIRALQEDFNALKGNMLLDTSDIRDAYANGSIGQAVSFIPTTASKTIVNIISVISGQKYTVSVTYGSEIASANNRQPRCVDASNIVTQALNLPTVSNSIQTIEFTAVSDGFLCLTVDAKYTAISIVGADPNIAEQTQKKIDAVNDRIDTIDAVISNSKSKAFLISCIRNLGWIMPNGAKLLTGYCNEIGIDGWVDVKPSTSISSTTGEDEASFPRRQASGYIDVNGFSSITSAFEDSSGYGVFYAVRCYDASKAFLGSASNSQGNEGTLSGSDARFFVQNTRYIRLLLTPNTHTDPDLDLDGVYTGRVLDAVFVNGNTSVTKKLAFVEVEDFDV